MTAGPPAQPPGVTPAQPPGVTAGPPAQPAGEAARPPDIQVRPRTETIIVTKMISATEVITVRSVAWSDASATTLRAAMATEMEVRYADRHGSSSGRHAPGMNVDADTVVFTGVAYDRVGDAVGHAALRRNGADLELKRMYVAPASRGTGVSIALLDAIEIAARERGARRVILRTGDRQPDAVRLYRKAGYTPIPIFPPYEDPGHAFCFERLLDPAGR
jgi:GNAT superfamily N-acetyltransferase